MIVVNFCLKGERMVIQNFTVAGGIFKQDQLVPIFESIVNIVLSLLFVQRYGLVGVYLGTFISSLLPNFFKPYIVYKYLFETSIKMYLGKYLRENIFLIVTTVFIAFVTHPLTVNVTWLKFIILTIITILLSNGLILVFYHKTKEFKYLKKEIL